MPTKHSRPLSLFYFARVDMQRQYLLLKGSSVQPLVERQGTTRDTSRPNLGSARSAEVSSKFVTVSSITMSSRAPSAVPHSWIVMCCLMKAPSNGFICRRRSRRRRRRELTTSNRPGSLAAWHYASLQPCQLQSTHWMRNCYSSWLLLHLAVAILGWLIPYLEAS